MIRSSAIILSLLALLAGCKQHSKKQEIDPANLTEKQKINIRVQQMNHRAIEFIQKQSTTTDTALLKMALKELDSALIIKPGYWAAIHNKFRVQYELKDLKGALETNDTMIKRNDLAPELIIHRANLFGILGKKDSAQKYYKVGLQKFREMFTEINATRARFHSQLEVPWESKLLFAESLAFAGYTKEANDSLQKVKEQFFDPPPFLKNYDKLRPYSAWMTNDSWPLQNDNVDYTKDEYR